MRIAGCDLGKASASFVVAEVTGEGLTVLSREHVDHEGQAIEAFCDWYERAGIADCAGLGATGIHAAELSAPALANLPEEACLEAALAARTELEGPLALLSVGARGYAALARGPEGRLHWHPNQKCSSGTGETMVKIAGRFGLSLQEADALALEATRSIPITARCSVFAKSEMTHHGNQGRPADELFRGYFASVASYVAALEKKAHRGGPVLLIGGLSRVESFRQALSEALEPELRVPEWPLHFEALGAAVLASEGSAAHLPQRARDLVERRERRFRVLAPAREHASRVTRLVPPPVPEGASRRPTLLGIDLGSTGSKAVLVDLETGEPVLDLYDKTRGNPVDALRRLVAELRRREPRADVRALGLTGSGREAAAIVARAALGESADRIGVFNEIVAHATAAIRCDPTGGASLSVVEIGGQDAKFIQIQDGRIVESDMNKACSAGTGSFLEEQAVFYGVDDIEDFTREAATATRPPELGQMCTVFVAEAAAEAHNQGFDRADLFGGFQYAVVHNYLNRVMGQRTFGERIFFQGKPATGPSLAWTLAGVTGREVFVPPSPGAMGAWGIGLCVREELAGLESAPSLELAAIEQAEVLARGEFTCRDPRCATLCRIERTEVAVAGTRHKVLSGGACPRYELAARAAIKLPVEAPSAFDEREALLARWLADDDHPGAIGVPLVGAATGYLPWLVTFVRELGRPVRVLRSGPHALSKGEAACYAFDACAPVKLAHGVMDAELQHILLPKLLGLGDRDGPGGATCPMEQALPEMVREALRGQGRDVVVVSPSLDLSAGVSHQVVALAAAARELGASRRRVPQALRAAWAAQQRWEEGLRAIGERTLRWGRQSGVPVVVVCGALHTTCDRALDASIPEALRRDGVLALPMDCLPLSPGDWPLERVPWAEARRALQAALTCRTRGDAYPLLLSSFGCGPGSFTEQVFTTMMAGHPHTALESDGHGGEAGFVTRVQAFLHTVRRHDGRPSAAPREALRALDPLPEPPINGSRVAVLAMGDRLSANIAAVYRSYGVDAVSTGPTSAAALAAGRRDCSGKECLPYQLIWGCFREHLDEQPPEDTVLLQVPGSDMCRNCMFSVKDQLTLHKLGLGDRVRSRHVGMERELGRGFMGRLLVGVVTDDLLTQLVAWYRPELGEEVEELYRRRADDLEALLERGGNLAHTIAAAGRLLERASLDVNALLETRPERTELRTVLLSGDVYLRVDDFASDGLIARLNARRLRVLVEPIGLLSEYLAEERLPDLMGLPTTRVENAAVKRLMRRVRAHLSARVRRHHPWLPASDLAPMLTRGRKLLARYPKGEAPMTIGSVLRHWDEGVCDGVVVVSPWGCGPAMVAESMLRHEAEIPLLFLYGDGSPMDTRRLDGFSMRLHRRERIAAAHG